LSQFFQHRHAGNSLAGVAMLEKLTQRMGRSVF
ncbi:hypothetical protein, partial [Klebsiella pneumoniae]